MRDLTTSTRRRLLKIVRAVEIKSEAEFKIGGELIGIVDQSPGDKHREAFQKDPLVYFLRRQIYRRFYAAHGSLRRTTAPMDPEQFIAGLSAANTGRTVWDKSWEVTELKTGGHVAVAKGAKRSTFPPGQYYCEGDGLHPRVGDLVCAKLVHESLSVQEGMYFALGETAPDDEDRQFVTRLYWNVDPAGVDRLVRVITSEFNGHGVSFRLKCPVSPGAFNRVDAAVLYTGARHLRTVWELARRAYPEVKSYLRTGTPLFSLRVARGIGFAESPDRRLSFGMHRCGLVAQGLRNAWNEGARGEAEQIEQVRKCFEEKGLCLARPYVNRPDLDSLGVEELPLWK